MTATVDISGSAASHWSEERINIACQASYQTEDLLIVLKNAGMEAGGNICPSLLLTVLVRLKELNGVVTSLLSEDGSRKTTEMSKIVFGEWAGEGA